MTTKDKVESKLIDGGYMYSLFTHRELMKLGLENGDIVICDDRFARMVKGEQRDDGYVNIMRNDSDIDGLVPHRWGDDGEFYNREYYTLHTARELDLSSLTS